MSEISYLALETAAWSSEAMFCTHTSLTGSSPKRSTRPGASLLLIGAILLTIAACDSDGGSVTGDAGSGSADAGGNCNPACSGDTPICAASGTCVECEVSAHCPAEAPLCNGSQCVAGCAGSAVTADLVTRPPDIIWVVDQSGSMDQETSYVQQKINDFVTIIDASGIDYRVVMIADPDADNAICVAPPLAGASCGDNTRFRLVPTEVASHDGPELAVGEYSQYQDFLRTDSLKHFVFVTDDDSDWSASEFTDAVLALPPAGSFDGFRVHGIYAFGTPGGEGCDGAFGSGAAEGTVYTELIAATGGASGVICTGNWDQVFMDIQASVISGSQIACDLAIPPPPANETIDPGNVDVRYLPGGVSPGATLGRVTDAGSCGASGGWYYDDPAAPTQIILCPASCTEIRSDQAASLQIEFGCSTGGIG